jgi:hypothetical protein
VDLRALCQPGDDARQPRAHPSRCRCDAHGYSACLRGAIARWAVSPGGTLPSQIWTVGPTVQRSVLSLEKFPDTFNFGYFIVKIAALLLAVLALVQALIDVARPAKD